MLLLMCGIFSLLNVDYSKFSLDIINESFLKGQNRGPESSVLKNYLNCIFGFHRLAINGLDNNSNQPIYVDDILLICNGEIFNYQELYTLIGETPSTNSDCEIIIHLYKKFGIEYTLELLDGEYAFVLLDCRMTKDNLENYIYIARDPFGIRPLYYLQPLSNSPSHLSYKMLGFASELKMLIDFNNSTNPCIINQFTPGTYSLIKLGDKTNSRWEPVFANKVFFKHVPASFAKVSHSYMDICNNLSKYLEHAVISRCKNTERPVACLLSGGLDSSTVCAIAHNYFKSINKELETFSIGLADSEDLKHARKVSTYLGTKHTEIIVDETEMFTCIKDVIYAIESYDTTTIRASIGNYLVGKYIKQNSEAKVILNGDGSDELFGGYLYFHNYKNDIEFDKEIKHLLTNIHYFDVLRSDKCISCHGLEPRTPFLDKNLVNYYLSLPLDIRNHNNSNKMEKQLVRDAVSLMQNSNRQSILPKDIIYRKKEAFSDGVSSLKRSLFTIIQEMIIRNDKSYGEYVGVAIEKAYYKCLFDEMFPNNESTIPYFWMPKFNQSDDPSARLLSVYSDTSPNTLKTPSFEITEF
jgi:asparagine synthase (glutamine-hydrolysing)